MYNFDPSIPITEFEQRSTGQSPSTTAMSPPPQLRSALTGARTSRITRSSRVSLTHIAKSIM